MTKKSRFNGVFGMLAGRILGLKSRTKSKNEVSVHLQKVK
jgi:hypothetical protein